MWRMGEKVRSNLACAGSKPKGGLRPSPDPFSKVRTGMHKNCLISGNSFIFYTYIFHLGYFPQCPAKYMYIIKGMLEFDILRGRGGGCLGTSFLLLSTEKGCSLNFLQD